MGADGSKEKYDEPVCDELLEATDAASVGYVMTSVRGIPQNPLFNVEMFESMIDTFETRDKDVFVCTYVKAGTTWAQQIVTLLCNGGEQGDKSYGEQVPWLEALRVPRRPKSETERGRLVPSARARREWPRRRACARSRRRVRSRA